MSLSREGDTDYEFEYVDGFPLIPDGTAEDENGLFVLPNGKYLPSGGYAMKDGSTMIYEPRALSPFSDQLKNCTEE